MSNEYESAFEGDSETEARRRRRRDLAEKPRRPTAGRPDGALFSEERAKHEGRVRRLHFLALNAYDRHKELINNYHLYHPGAAAALRRDTSRDRNDYDVLREQHRFVWTAEDAATDSWERRLAKRYYDKLYREYCICDLTYYKLNRVAMRWRTEQEVIAGKGQFTCGSKHCSAKDSLTSWEVNFSYAEHGEQKNCLVKLRLCPDCSRKLNHSKPRRKAKLYKRKKTKKEKKSRRGSSEQRDDVSEAGPSGGGPSGAAKDQATPQSDDIWKQPAVVEEEKTRDEEFDEFLADLFM